MKPQQNKTNEEKRKNCNVIKTHIFYKSCDTNGIEKKILLCCSTTTGNVLKTVRNEWVKFEVYQESGGGFERSILKHQDGAIK
jgi:hypothetical protein